MRKIVITDTVVSVGAGTLDVTAVARLRVPRNRIRKIASTAHSQLLDATVEENAAIVAGVVVEAAISATSMTLPVTIADVQTALEYQYGVAQSTLDSTSADFESIGVTWDSVSWSRPTV